MLSFVVTVLSLVVQPHAGVRNVHVRTSTPEMIFGIGSKAAAVLTGKGMVVPTSAFSVSLRPANTIHTGSHGTDGIRSLRCAEQGRA